MSAKEINPTEFHHTYEESVFTREFPEERVYDDTYDIQEKVAWGGRPWVSTTGGQQRDPNPVLAKENGISILTYNTFADCKCTNVRYSTTKKWAERCRTLIKEIASYNADILCLQDVDHFGDWWRPQLMIIGYDSVYKRRTQKRSAHYEGVLIAYKRNSFQLFRSVQLELNKTRSLNTNEMGSAFKERLVTDDVAIICMLQPWKVPKEKKEAMKFTDKFSSIKPVKNRFAKLRAKQIAAGLITVVVNKEGNSESIIDNDEDDESAPPLVDSLNLVSKAKEEPIEEATATTNAATKGDPLEDFTAFEDSEPEEENVSSDSEPEFDDGVQSAICVVSAQLSSREQDADVRYYQAQYIMREVEIANKEFHLPVAVGVSLYDSPISSAYHVFKTGRSPIKPQAPRKCNPPRGIPFCRGSTRLCWKAPIVTKEDPPILAYKLAWRPGGSLTLGFRLQMEVDPVMCLAYGEKIDEHGIKRTYQLDELQFTIPGLTSDIPFEFIVCAVNEIGEGIWSDPSMPVVMPNPKRAPPMPSLKVFRDTKQVRELREGSNMGLDDWDVEIAISSNPLNSRTQMTPRLIDGRKDREVSSVRILPMSINPREGWKKGLGGGYNEELVEVLMDPKILNTSILRKREEETDPGTFLPSISDSPRGKRALVTGVSTKHFLLAEDPQNNGILSLFDTDVSIATDATEASSVNFNGAFSSRRYDKTLTAMIAREKIYRTGDLESSLADLENSYIEEAESDNEGFGDGLDVEMQNQEGDEETKSPVIVVEPGGTDTFPSATATATATGADGVGSPASPDKEEVYNDDDSMTFQSSVASTHTGTATREYNRQVAEEAFNLDIKKAEMAKLEDMRIANLEGLRDISRVTSKLNDSTYLDGADLFKNIGKPHARTLHSLPMRSAYEMYASGGEPLYTTSFPAENGLCGVQCSDYLFYTGTSMYATHILAIPEISHLRGENPREMLACADPMFISPKPQCVSSFNRNNQFIPKGGYDSSKPANRSVVNNAKNILLEMLKASYTSFENQNIPVHAFTTVDTEKKQQSSTSTAVSAYWAGVWAPFVARNEQREMHWLPNEVFTSSHLALGAKISFIEGNLVTNWR